MSNLFLLNTVYLKEKWIPKQFVRPGEFSMEKVSEDCIILTILDLDTEKVELKIIERPNIDYYVTKDRDRTYPEMFLPENELIKRTVEYSMREKALAKELGIYNEYMSTKRSSFGSKEGFSRFRKWMSMNIYNSPFIYMADIDIEDYYKTKFIEENGNNVISKLNVSYFDIEVYIYKERNRCNQDNPIRPINMISYINTNKKILYGLCLRFKEIPDIDLIENDKEGYLSEYIRPDYAESDPDMDFKLEFYESETLLITRFFQLVHEDKPYFCMAWNSNYDIKYIMGRALLFNMNLNTLFCHKDVPAIYQQFSYKEDRERHVDPDEPNKRKSAKSFHRMWDWCKSPGYTVYIDQMSLYSNLRKRKQFPSYALNSIATKELKMKKLSLPFYGLTIRNGPFKDFKRFLAYSLRDTYILYKLEEKLNDTKMLYVVIGNTRLEKGLDVSIVIKNAFLDMYRNSGKVIGNNVDYDVYESIKAAIVAKPLLADVECVLINGQKSNVYKHVVDFDAKEEYPTQMKTFNIGKNSTYGKITNVRDKESGKWLMGGAEFNESLQTLDTCSITMCNKLFGLPTIEEILRGIELQLSEL